MTTEKARKRAIRARMTKTGERYAAARRHLVAGDSAETPPERPALPPRVADPGMTDESIAKGTGSGWDEWLRALDAWGATDHSHTDIARYLREHRGVDGWWAQALTVGYERARGLRAKHQTTRGIEVSVSKTVGAPAAIVWEAFLQPRERERWLASGELGARRRTGAIGASATFDIPSDGTRVTVAVTPRDDGRTTVTIVHMGLADAADVERRRADWKQRLERLAARWANAAASSQRTSRRARAVAGSADD